MAEESDLSRTEPASPRRLQQALSQGDVARSAELTAWVVLLSALVALIGLAPRIFNALSLYLETALQSAAQPFPTHPFDPLLSVGAVLLPLLGLIFVALLIAPLLLSGWVFSPGAVNFNAQRLNPLAPMKRLFSIEGLFIAIKTLSKFALVGIACWLTLSGEWGRLFALPSTLPVQALSTVAGVLMKGLLTVVGLLTVIAVLDTTWSWWRYRARHAMTWQELMAEAQESEGSPEMRARMRGRQQAAVGAHLTRPRLDSSETSEQIATYLPKEASPNVRPKEVDV